MFLTLFPMTNFFFETTYYRLLVMFLVMRLTRPSLYTSVPVTNETQDLPGL